MTAHRYGAALLEDIITYGACPNRSPKDPRVVLIHPPAISKRYLQTKFMPYGMAVLYAFLKEHSVPTVQYDFLMEYLFDAEEDIDYHNPEKTFSDRDFFGVLDGGGSHQGLAAFVEKYGSRLIQGAGIYAFSIVAYHQFWASLLLARYIRKVNPDAVIVFGGPFITIKPVKSFVPYGQADYWVKGSGEVPLLMLHRLHQETSLASKGDIPGIIFFDKGNLFQAPRSRLAAEEERAPDFEGLDLHRYRYNHPLTGEQTFFLPYRISKGCPSRCTFCTGRLVDRYDVKSVDKVVAELSGLSKKYRTSLFQFADASINGNPRRLAELCDRLAEVLPDIRWYSYAKVNGFTPDLLRKVKNAGCFSLFWGVESAHQPTVHLLGKRFDVDKMYDLIDEAISAGIKSYIHLMYNTPHESAGDVEGFIRLVDRYLRSEQVVFLPQRFLLEPQSLMTEAPQDYGLTNLREVGGSVFEREQFLYEEIDGSDHETIEARNQRNRDVLAYHLDLIRYRNMLDDQRSGLFRLFSPRLLVRSGRLLARNRVTDKLHTAFVRWIESNTRAIKEKL
ncbi:MAG: radical SAM protein [Desulfomonile tiedjei]|nr:radical SAM protein [Desulfomonile tiedjei]